MNDPESLIFIYFIIILSVIFHEYSHAWMAYYLGDPTAKNAGRLTLNPVAHIDPFGTVLLPLFLMFTVGAPIGYAKPVPYNPYNLRDQEYGEVKVAVAGPASNFLIAIILSLVLRFFSLPTFWVTALISVISINIILGLFNLIPIRPLDGSKILERFTSVDLYSGKNKILAILIFILAILILPDLARTILYYLL